MMRFIFVSLLIASYVLMAMAAPEPQGAWSYVRGATNRGVDFVRGAYRGTGAMIRSYNDMREANFKNSDKYFHARGNRDAAAHGPGGSWAARVISNGRERTDRLRGKPSSDSAADQAANRLGRSGGDISILRPEKLDSRY